MNITTLISRIRKGTVAKLLAAGVLAGAVAIAMPVKANAQEAIVFAGPRPGFPVYARYDRYDRFRAEEFRRREDWRRERFDRRFEYRHDRRFYR